MVWFGTGPPGAAGRRTNNFCLDSAEFCHWSLSPGRGYVTLKAMFGQCRENFRNLWREKFIRQDLQDRQNEMKRVPKVR